jgi:hypothetical protein
MKASRIIWLREFGYPEAHRRQPRGGKSLQRLPRRAALWNGNLLELTTLAAIGLYADPHIGF